MFTVLTPYLSMTICKYVPRICCSKHQAKLTALHPHDHPLEPWKKDYLIGFRIPSNNCPHYQCMGYEKSPTRLGSSYLGVSINGGTPYHHPNFRSGFPLTKTIQRAWDSPMTMDTPIYCPIMNHIWTIYSPYINHSYHINHLFWDTPIDGPPHCQSLAVHKTRILGVN